MPVQTPSWTDDCRWWWLCGTHRAAAYHHPRPHLPVTDTGTPPEGVKAQRVQPTKSKPRKGSRPTHCIASCMSWQEQQRLDHFGCLNEPRDHVHEGVNSPRVYATVELRRVGDDGVARVASIAQRATSWLVHLLRRGADVIHQSVSF